MYGLTWEQAVRGGFERDYLWPPGHMTRLGATEAAIVEILDGYPGEVFETYELAAMLPWTFWDVTFDCAFRCVGDDDGTAFGLVVGCEKSVHVVLRQQEAADIFDALTALMRRRRIQRYWSPGTSEFYWSSNRFMAPLPWQVLPREQQLDGAASRIDQSRTQGGDSPQIALTHR
ncbi:hypothetical protein BKG82_26285 [Mycobacteroides chelonae]|uniref:Uncharacterized protein n=1 Tax=Mycobacteroides chelonae TaxID=1774 RepID=A0A1S1LCN0_MYCCH|nr:hypothetical protein [Mycobacteroides chelonae]OHU47168.1 hypothetical protein BKG82_26285 [Mycobacteroides chelonae]